MKILIYAGGVLHRVAQDLIFSGHACLTGKRHFANWATIGQFSGRTYGRGLH